MATAGTFVFNRGEISLSNLLGFRLPCTQKVIVPRGVSSFVAHPGEAYTLVTS
jgi:hypothetical protein